MSKITTHVEIRQLTVRINDILIYTKRTIFIKSGWASLFRLTNKGCCLLHTRLLNYIMYDAKSSCSKLLLVVYVQHKFEYNFFFVIYRNFPPVVVLRKE